MQLLLAVLTLVVSLTLFPPLCNADFTLIDVITYGEALQAVLDTGEDRVGVLTNPPHPLPHLLAYLVALPLRELGFTSPAYLAGRILSALGAAVLVLVIARMARARHWIVGTAFAAVVIVTRGFLLEAGTGETVLPALAAMAVALYLATRDRPRPIALAIAMIIALLLRQDSLFIVPGVLIAAAAVHGRGERWRCAWKLLLPVGLVTVAAYAAFWLADPLDQGFFEYLLRTGMRGSWSSADALGVSRVPLHEASWGWALVGRQGELDDIYPWIPALFAGGVVVMGRMLRGTAPMGRLGLAVVITIAIRIPFLLWFEPENWEWQVLPVAFIACLGAAMTAGEPQTSRRTRGLGVSGLLIGAVIIAAVHGSDTWRLRDDNLYRAVTQAVERGGEDCVYISLGTRATAALSVLRVTQEPVPDNPIVPFPADMAESCRKALRLMQATPGPSMIVVDRFVRDGMPHTLRNLHRFDFLDGLLETPGVTVLRQDGQVYAVGMRLKDR